MKFFGLLFWYEHLLILFYLNLYTHNDYPCCLCLVLISTLHTIYLVVEFRKEQLLGMILSNEGDKSQLYLIVYVVINLLVVALKVRILCLDLSFELCY